MKKSAISIKKGGLILIAALLSFEFIVSPWLNWLDDNQQILNNLKKIVAKQEQVLSSADMLTSQTNELSAKLQTFEGIPTLQPKRDPALLWLQVVDSAVARYDIKVNNKAPLREVDINDTYAVYAGQLNVSGDYNHVLNLLHELENITIGNRVRQVSLIQDKALAGQVTANIEFLRVFKKS